MYASADTRGGGAGGAAAETVPPVAAQAIAERRIVVRASLPEPYGRLLATAREHRYPILVSANVFARWTRTGRTFRGFATPRLLAGMDCALDSAGYVAASQYGGYPWTKNQYYDLVEAFPWAWHAARDYCITEDIAGDRRERRMRVAATVASFAECAGEAVRRGLAAPVPVLQGWTADDYRACAHQLGFSQWPALVGVGSLCGRRVAGPDGVGAVLDALDAMLPAHVRLHLFAVKGTALGHFAGHARIASTDSMAWDYAARQEARKADTSCTVERRAAHLTRWMQRQRTAASAGAGWSYQTGLLAQLPSEPAPDCAQWLAQQAESWWTAMVADQEMDDEMARWWLLQDSLAADDIWREHGHIAFTGGAGGGGADDAEIAELMEDELPGLRERLWARNDWAERRAWLIANSPV